MHCNTLNPYLKEVIKVNNYNCLYIGNLKKIAYCTYPYYLDVFLYKNMSKIYDANCVHFMIYKDLTSVEMFIYERYAIRLFYSKK